MLTQTTNQDASGNLVVSGSVTANAGTNLNTSALALETGGNLAAIKANTDNLSVSQGASTVGQKGSLELGAVSTSAPSYSTGQINPLSLNVNGGLRVDGSGVTQPISANALPLPTGAATAAKQPALGTAGSASADVLTVQGATGMTPIQTTQASATTGAITSVAASVTSVTILASNTARKGLVLFNDSTSIARVAFAGTASATSFTILMQPNSFYENNTLYTGIITGIWNTAAGSMRVTELS